MHRLQTLHTFAKALQSRFFANTFTMEAWNGAYEHLTVSRRLWSKGAAAANIFT